MLNLLLMADRRKLGGGKRFLGIRFLERKNKKIIKKE
jgi:hypothetical protein